jgi:protein-S-isoprenylcysteine O-methyltransferase Ste14
MRKLKESRAMQDDLISCVTILGFSIFYISDHLELEPWHRTIMTVGLVFCIAEMILRLWRLRRNKRMTPEEQREAKRENSDERSRMILDKATKYCWSIETPCF